MRGKNGERKIKFEENETSTAMSINFPAKKDARSVRPVLDGTGWNTIRTYNVNDEFTFTVITAICGAKYSSKYPVELILRVVYLSGASYVYVSFTFSVTRVGWACSGGS